jgi:hypothetical protein
MIKETFSLTYWRAVNQALRARGKPYATQGQIERVMAKGYDPGQAAVILAMADPAGQAERARLVGEGKIE